MRVCGGTGVLILMSGKKIAETLVGCSAPGRPELGFIGEFMFPFFLLELITFYFYMSWLEFLSLLYLYCKLFNKVYQVSR